jgi:hypothetical protein
MELHFYKVISSKVRKTRRPKIAFSGNWLASAGFEPGTLFTAGFAMGEAVLKLCDISAESVDGDKLLSVKASPLQGKSRPRLHFSGRWLENFGFSIGAYLIVIVRYGLIRVKILNGLSFKEDVRFFKIISLNRCGVERLPKITFSGEWLTLAGFETNTLVTVKFTMGEAAFELCGADPESAGDLIRRVKNDGAKLLHVRSCIMHGHRRPLFDLYGQWLAGFGFSIGAHIAVTASCGVIKAKILNTDTFVP